MTRQSRVPLEARRAEREANERALKARLTPAEHRVYLALQNLITKYDRTSDRVTNGQIVSLTGIDSRQVRRALSGLAAKAIIHRVPGIGRKPSLVSFDLDSNQLREDKSVLSQGSESTGERGQDRPPREDNSDPSERTGSSPESGQDRPLREDTQVSDSEVSSEVSSEERGPAPDNSNGDALDMVRSLITNHHRCDPSELEGLAAEYSLVTFERLSSEGRRFAWPSALRPAARLLNADPMGEATASAATDRHPAERPPPPLYEPVTVDGALPMPEQAARARDLRAALRGRTTPSPDNHGTEGAITDV